MNACSRVRSQLGEYLDNELAPGALVEVGEHLEVCAKCRSHLEELAGAAAVITGLEVVAVPQQLWTLIDRRLDEADPPHAQPEKAAFEQMSPARFPRLRFRPGARLATAAAVILAAGLGFSAFISYDRRAGASEIDFSVLLEALPADVEEAFARFIAHNKGQRMTPQEVRRFAPGLTFDTPIELPGGFRLKEVYALRVGENPGVAARYERDGEFLAAIFHPPVKREDFGSHKDYPCVVGKHRGHAVTVGEWKLVHLTDPTTCHCVLSRLDEHAELPAVMRLLAPGIEEQH